MLDVYDIISEDEDFLFINKRAGILSIPDRFNQEKLNLYSILKQKYEQIYVTHRLDKDTSGIICFAKNKDAHRNMCLLFENRKIKKTYLALVKGQMQKYSGIINVSIEENKNNSGKMKTYFLGKKSITEYKVIEMFKDYTYVEVNPKTGRTHQIRIHFLHIGHPLAVDPIYGTDSGIFLSDIKPGYKVSGKEKPLMNRLTLHSYKIEFFDYKKDKEIKIIAPLPKDFEITLKQLRKYGSIKN